MHRTHLRMLEFIRNWQETHNYPCTIREIMAGADIHSSSSVAYAALKLREAGLIEYTDGEARTMVIAGSKYQLPPAIQ